MKKLLSMALLAVLPLNAQVRESMTVEVIEVPVYVTDSAGKPIRGLTRDAFELRVNGTQQPIESFDVVDVAAAPAEERPARQRRLYLLLFDLAYATMNDVHHAQTSAAQLIEGDPYEGDLFAVAKFKPREGVQFLCGFLSSKPEIRRAIFTLSPSEAHDPLGVAINEEERKAWIKSTGGELEAPSGRGGLATAERAAALRGGPANQAAVAQPQSRLTEYQINGLDEMVAHLSGLEGQKHVVFFTEGARAAPSEIYLRDLGRAFRQAGAFLHAVGMLGGNRDTLRLITQETGGRFFWGQDFVASLRGLTQSQEVSYLLSFRRHEVGEGKITVKVQGLPAGASVHYRTGYGVTTTRKDVDQLVLADIVTNDVPQSGIDLDGFIKPAKDGAELTLRFPREQVVAQLDPNDPAVEVYMYIFDTKGGSLKFVSKRILFDEQAREGTGRVGLRETFELPPGQYVAKALVAVHGSSAVGFMRGEFTVEQ
jgi:VWFA-related protein